MILISILIGLNVVLNNLAHDFIKYMQQLHVTALIYLEIFVDGDWLILVL